MLNTHSDAFLQFAFWTGIGAVFLALIAGGLIVYLRLALRRRTRREQAFIAVWRPILADALASQAPSALPRLSAHERLFFLALWIQLQESIRGPESAGILQIAQRLGCNAFARDLLMRGNHAEQLLAILALGHLGDRSAWNILVIAVRGVDTVKSLTALRSLVQIDAERTAKELLPILLDRAEWPLARVAALLKNAQAAFNGPLLNAAEDAQGDRLIRALRLIEALRLHLPNTTLSRLLNESQPIEVIISALRVTLTPDLLPQARSYLKHEDWRVRVQVARLLGRIGEKQDMERLSSLLGDPEWWVRYRAAVALVGLPFVGRRQLDLLRKLIADPYARDMLDQALIERGAA